MSPAAATALVSESQKLVATTPVIEERFGYPLALDGDLLVLGALGASDVGPLSGAAYVYRAVGGTWVLEARLTASDSSAGDRFGHAVDVDGESIIVGAVFDDDLGDRSGSAYVFRRVGGVWVEEAKLVASDGAVLDQFGHFVALDEDTALVTALRDDGQAGAVYVFVRNGAIWLEQAKLVASDRAAGDFFGQEIAIDGDSALIGSVWDDDLGTNSGSAYLFTRSGTTWQEEAKLTASDGSPDDRFGSAVALDGGTAVVGAWSRDESSYNSGAAYIFGRVGGIWLEQGKLIASDGAAGDEFARAVALDGNSAVIGAPGDDVNASISGSAYLFTRSSGVWTEEAKLIPTDTNEGDAFGASLAVDGTVVAGSAPNHDDGASNAGAVYVFGTNSAPAVAVSAPDVTTSEGVGSATAGSFTDAQEDSMSISCACPNGSLTDHGDGSWSWTGTPPDGPSTFEVTVTAIDPFGAFAEDRFTVSVANSAPTADLQFDDSVPEGTTFSLSLVDPIDPSEADSVVGFEYAFDCGDGEGYGAFSGSSSVPCPAIDDGALAARAKIRDKDGGVSEYTTGVAVVNVAPTITSLVGASLPVALGTPVSAVVTFTDPGTADTFDVTWEWGDTESSEQLELAGSPATDSHQYLGPGVYSVTVTVVDDDGGSDSGVFRFVVIYDPDGASVTGGGHLVPDGDDTYPGVEGGKKANFGFNARYENGVPQGNLNAKLGDLHVKSVDIQWLVIRPSVVSTFQGAATIDGSGLLHPFRVTANDADVPGGHDTFTLQLWAPSTDPFMTAPLYILTGPLDGGKIQIHR